MASIKHCLANLKHSKAYYLEPLTSRVDILCVIAYEFDCPHCKNVLHQWCNVFDNGKEGPMRRIRPDDWRNDWLQRIEAKREADKQKEIEMRAQIHVGEFTKKVSRSPDEVMQYLKRVI